MLLSVNNTPKEYKYLKNNSNENNFIFVDTDATPEEKANLKKYDQNCLEIFGYHLIQNYDDLDK